MRTTCALSQSSILRKPVGSQYCSFAAPRRVSTASNVRYRAAPSPCRSANKEGDMSASLGSISPGNFGCSEVVRFSRKQLVQSCQELKQGSRDLLLHVVMTAVITLPPSTAAPGPYPVIIFLNGFGTVASWYKALVAEVARAGYVVVQYDINRARLGPHRLPAVPFNIEDEAAILEPLHAWLTHLNEGKSATAQVAGNLAAGNKLQSKLDKLQGKLDMQRMAVGGHSRGGQLATLIYARHAGGLARTSYLVDPVDLMPPRAADKLRELEHTVDLGIAWAPRTGAFNPRAVNWETIWEVAGPQSEATEVNSATHMDFCDAGGLNWFLDALNSMPGLSNDVFVAISVRGMAALAPFVQRRIIIKHALPRRPEPFAARLLRGGVLDSADRSDIGDGEFLAAVESLADSDEVQEAFAQHYNFLGWPGDGGPVCRPMPLGRRMPMLMGGFRAGPPKRARVAQETAAAMCKWLDAHLKG